MQDVRCVIHYQLPASADVYVHRSGRTARGTQEGITIALVTPKEAARYQGLQKAMDRPVPSDFPVDNSLMPAVSALSALLCLLTCAFILPFQQLPHASCECALSALSVLANPPVVLSYCFA